MDSTRGLPLPRTMLGGIVSILVFISGCIIVPATPTSPNLDSNLSMADRHTSNPQDSARNKTEIFVPPLKGVPFYTELQPETDGGDGSDTDPDVSPDGTRIAFSSTRFSKEPKVFMKDTQNGSIYQKSSGPGRDIQPKFSPDGQWIAFASDRAGNYDILVIPADRNEAYWQLTSSSGDEIHPTWSPDSKRIAYCARENDGDWSLWIIELGGQRRTQLGPGLYPEWSPDGEYLAFQRPSRRGQGWYGIWIVNAAGGAPREIATDSHFGYVQPSWSPDSSRLTFATVSAPVEDLRRAQAEDLWIVDLDDGRRFRLTTHAGQDYAPAWGLDDRIYFTSHRSGSAGIWSLEPAHSPTPFESKSARFPKRVARP